LTILDEKSGRISECQNEIKEKSAKVKELENKMKNLKAIRETEMKTAESELKRMKKKAEDSRNNWKKREQVMFFVVVKIKLKHMAIQKLTHVFPF
jgi:structural maintenance of chromosome 2